MTVVINKIPESRKYWIVRAGENASFFNHFRTNGVVALGHADIALDVSAIIHNPQELVTSGELRRSVIDQSFLFNNFPINSNTIKDEIINMHRAALHTNGDAAHKIGNINAQVKDFVRLIQSNDIIITVNKNSVMAGRVISGLYISDNPIVYRDGNVETACEYKLRYNVIWSRAYSRTKIPYVLEKALKNTRAVSKMNDEDTIKILNHWLSPIHEMGNKICFSVEIGSTDNISNSHLSSVSRSLDVLEALSIYIDSRRIVESQPISVEDFYIFLQQRQYNSWGALSLTSQHAFMSPGFQFFQLDGSETKKALYALIFSASFGTNVSYADDRAPIALSDAEQALVSEVMERNNIELGFLEAKENLVMSLTRSNDSIVVNSDVVGTNIERGNRSPNEDDDGFGRTIIDDETML
ncbi:hypothetical protein ACSZM9_12655 [Aeromonas hydrophila]|uniref:hypothetical protein n=1 Tax=Aeromonas hydrophila TaxID=644 RepID=UPI003EC5A2C6